MRIKFQLCLTTEKLVMENGEMVVVFIFKCGYKTFCLLLWFFYTLEFIIRLENIFDIF